MQQSRHYGTHSPRLCWQHIVVSETFVSTISLAKVFFYSRRPFAILVEGLFLWDEKIDGGIHYDKKIGQSIHL